jgi:cytochrome b561
MALCMQLKNSTTSYGAVAMLFHRVIVGLHFIDKDNVLRRVLPIKLRGE